MDKITGFGLALSGVVAGFLVNTKSTYVTDHHHAPARPLVISTWAFPGFPAATSKAWQTLMKLDNRLDAVVDGCSTCEELQCDGTVGFGGSPDEKGNSTLDAMIMDGPTHNMGAVGSMKGIKNAIGVARAVMEHSKHSLLVGESATNFAVEMGFDEISLNTDHSTKIWQLWRDQNCQPNFRINVDPDPQISCGPYEPRSDIPQKVTSSNFNIGKGNHDTMGIVVIDSRGDVACGVSTNGASHKVPGRVGDGPIPGAGCYLDNEVGGAAETGDGDILMRFSPTYQTVENMRNGFTPSIAAARSLERIGRYYPDFQGAIVAAHKDGSFGAACHGIGQFSYCFANNHTNGVVIHTVRCFDNID